MWLRYKHKWASGIRPDWQYIEWDDNYPQTKKGEEAFIDDSDICSEGNWSDKYSTLRKVGGPNETLEVPPGVFEVIELCMKIGIGAHKNLYILLHKISCHLDW